MHNNVQTITLSNIIEYLKQQPTNLPVNTDRLYEAFNLLDNPMIQIDGSDSANWHDILSDLHITESDHILDQLDQQMLHGISDNQYGQVSILAKIAADITKTSDRYYDSQGDIYYEHANQYAYRLVTNGILHRKLTLTY